jgi:hypothetical protein
MNRATPALGPSFGTAPAGTWTFEVQQQATVLGAAPGQTVAPSRKPDVSLEAAIGNFHAMDRSPGEGPRQRPLGHNDQRPAFEVQADLIGRHAGQRHHDRQPAVMLEHLDGRFPHWHPRMLTS